MRNPDDNREYFAQLAKQDEENLKKERRREFYRRIAEREIAKLKLEASMSQVTSRLFMIDKYAEALAEKERYGMAIMRKYRHPTLGLCWQVIYVPQEQDSSVWEDRV